uniref:Uncharacterized protein n=1 Tax=Octopus bimaculoides TaxID=37653 RepID=A0A0L8G0M5_OCTBM
MDLLLFCVSQLFFGQVMNHSLKPSPIMENRLPSEDTGQPLLIPKSASQTMSPIPWSVLRLKKSIRDVQQKAKDHEEDDDDDDDDIDDNDNNETTNKNKSNNNNDNNNNNNNSNNNNNNNNNNNTNVDVMKVSNINNGSLQYRDQVQRNCSFYNETYTTDPLITEMETCRMCICEETAISDPTFIPVVAPVSHDLKVPDGPNEAKVLSYVIQCTWVPCLNLSLAVNSSSEVNNTEIFFIRTGFRVGKCLIAVGAVIACLLIAALLLSVHRFCQNRAHFQLHSQYEDDMY